MSDREKAIKIIDSIPDSQMIYILNMLQNFKSAVDEAADDAFCERMYESYLEDTDPKKDDSISAEVLAQNLGITL